MAGKRAAPGHIARHPDRMAIELAYFANMSLDRIAERYGVTRDSIWRHVKKLDPAYRAALVADVPLEQMAERAAKEGISLLDQLSVLRMGLMHSAIEAKAAGDHYAHATLSNAAVNAIREAGRLTGELKNVPTIQNVTNNVAVIMASPVMARLQTMLAQRLGPHPQALEAVLAGLAELEASEPGPGSSQAPASRIIEGTAHAA